MAESDILLYGDDDIVASPDWVGEIYKCYEDDTVSAASGKILPKFEVEPPRWIKLFPAIYLGTIDPGDEPMITKTSVVGGGNLSVRKDVLYAVRGFHPDSMPPDLIRFLGNGESGFMEKVAAAGYKMAYNPKAVIYHVQTADKLTIDFFKKRAIYQGVVNSYTIIRTNGGINEAAYEQEMSNPGWSTRIFNLLRCIRNGGLSFWRYYRYMQEVDEACKWGLMYHKSGVEKDPELLKWVLKESYLD